MMWLPPEAFVDRMRVKLLPAAAAIPGSRSTRARTWCCTSIDGSPT